MKDYSLWLTELRYWYLRRPWDRLVRWLVWRMPRKVVYWSAIRVGANATTGEHSDQVVTELLFSEALERWDPEER